MTEASRIVGSTRSSSVALLSATNVFWLSSAITKIAVSAPSTLNSWKQSSYIDCDFSRRVEGCGSCKTSMDIFIVQDVLLIVTYIFEIITAAVIWIAQWFYIPAIFGMRNFVPVCLFFCLRSSFLVYGDALIAASCFRSLEAASPKYA